MELQTEFVFQVMDILSRPMWWGISREIGSKLPISHAYFPYEHHLFRNLAGPTSQEYFQPLLAKVCGSVSPSGGQLCPSPDKAATKMDSIDHRSMWAMMMNFPAEAVAGCRIVFDVTNATEFISSSFFETEEEELDIVCQVKLKTGDYLFKCMKRLLQLLQFEFNGDGLLMQRDLLSGVISRRDQGKDVFRKNKDLDFVCNSLNVYKACYLLNVFYAFGEVHIVQRDMFDFNIACVEEV